MTKKNIKPQQTAPVQREINTTSSVDGIGEGGSTGLIPLNTGQYEAYGEWLFYDPFAGDDAE